MFFISKRINKDVDNNKIYFEIESIKMNNETFNAEPELDNLSQNSTANAGSSQFGFGIYNAGDSKFIGKSRFKSTRKSAKLKFLLGR